MKTMISFVQSPIGKKRLDSTGSAVGAARMDPAETYIYIAKLLQEYINTGSAPAWQKIRQRIDAIYLTVSMALEALEAASPFLAEIQRQVSAGKKLIFKPNMVTLPLIDWQTHGPGIPGANSHWEFVATVMRWFHDKAGITYHQMAVAEAGMTTPGDSDMISRKLGGKVTPEAILEGKYGDEYGGWGFYFTRKYLAECHAPGHADDPFQGYQESLAGVSLPPGRVGDKLMLYDLNRPDDDNSRDVPVAGGVNNQSITIHKAIVGGDPANPQDMKDWPGCVLINLPILKIHVLELLTCALKNIGMGIYAMQANSSREPGKYKWKYTIPDVRIPFGKLKLPHGRWSLQTDEDTFKPLRDSTGEFIWRRTGGMEATIADGMQAVKGQNILMLHVAEAIECTNIYHSGMTGVIVPEGFVFASNDPVALDNLGARYLFNMVPLSETAGIQKKYGLKSDIIQKIPSAKLAGKNIVTTDGYDSCYSRYHALQHCEQRGLGQLQFYVTGQDLWQGGALASLGHHLGRVDNGIFTDLVTRTAYHASAKPLMDFQAGMFAYLELDDRLTGRDHKRQLLQFQDENGDGVIDYLEGGKNAGSMAAFSYAQALANPQADLRAVLKLGFLLSMAPARWIRKEWNNEGYETGEQGLVGQAVGRAYNMSKAREEHPDPLQAGRVWGNGKWPSLEYVLHLARFSRIYGLLFPGRIDWQMSPYGQAFAYTDLVWNDSRYCTRAAKMKNEDIIGNYHQAVARGAKLLPFTVYVPRGFGSYDNRKIPNVEETDNPELIFTASFPDNETWRDLRLSDYPWLQKL
ncbi:MAG: DUF362 domain-containing protein [Dehalococcoidales bacterium]|jgi:hypothetical protein